MSCWLPSNSSTSVMLFTKIDHHFMCIHGAFSLSTNVHAQNSGTQTFLLRSFDKGIVKKLRKVFVLG